MSTKEKKKFIEPTIEVIKNEEIVDMYAYAVETAQEFQKAEGGY